MTSDEIKERDRIIVETRRKGEMSLKELALIYGISRERVRQIAEAGGVDPHAASAAFYENRRKHDLAKAEEHATFIVMRWIAGDSVSEIANAQHLSVAATQAVLDENLNDEMIAARVRSRTKRHFPDALDGPREEKVAARADRYWTRERCIQVLLQYALSEGGRLPSSTLYKERAKDDDNLPSFPTIRNRCGRWTDLRVEISNLIKEM